MSVCSKKSEFTNFSAGQFTAEATAVQVSVLEITCSTLTLLTHTDRNLSLEFYIIKNLTYLRCYNINYTNVYWNLYHVCEYIFDYNFSFQDHRAAFKSKTTWEVLRAMLVYQLCGINMLVDNNEKVKMVVLKIKKNLLWTSNIISNAVFV